MNRNISYTLLAIFALLLNYSCSKTDIDDPIDPGADPSFRCKVDGVLFEPSSLLIAGSKSESAGFYTVIASGFIVESGDTAGVLATITGMDFDLVENGTTFSGSGTPLDKLAIGSYSINPTVDEVDAVSTETGDATITITAIDKTAGVFSGTFSFVAKDPDTGDSFSITEGVFQNVEYN